MLSFLTWVTISIARFSLLIYRYGIFRWIWNHVKHYSKLFWEAVLELKNLYVIKVVVGVLLPFAVASSGYWLYYHFDVWAMLRATLDFIVNIPTYLLNSQLLMLAIHRWLNKMFLAHVVYYMNTVWTTSKITIINDPLRGALLVASVLGSIVVVLSVGLWIKRSIPTSLEELYEATKPPLSRKVGDFQRRKKNSHPRENSD